MAALPPSVEEAIRFTRPAIEQVLRTHSVMLHGEEHNNVDIDSIFEILKEAFRAVGMERFVRLEHQRSLSEADIHSLTRANSDFAARVRESFDVFDKRLLIALGIAGVLFQVFIGMVRGKSYDIPADFINILTALKFTVTPLSATAGGGGARAPSGGAGGGGGGGARAATAPSGGAGGGGGRAANAPAAPSQEEFERILNKSTFIVRRALDNVRPAAPKANKDLIDDMRAGFRASYTTKILPQLTVFRSIESDMDQLSMGDSVSNDIFRSPRTTISDIRAYTLFLIMNVVVGRKVDHALNVTQMTNVLEGIREIGENARFFAVRDPVAAEGAAAEGAPAEGAAAEGAPAEGAAAEGAAAEGAAAEGAAGAPAAAEGGGARANAVAPPVVPAAFEDPSCVVCGKPSKYRCARCARSSGPEGRYCSEKCQRDDWARGHGQYHAEKDAAAAAEAAAAKAEAAANNNGNPKRPSAATQRLTAARNENKDPALPVSKNEPKPPSERKSRKARRTRKHRF